ncbi:MAG: malonic semialdehyde reductase [Hyphomicrobiaceae bacterium]
MGTRLGNDVLKQLFTEARSHNAWQKKDVPDSLLAEMVDLMKMGPTSANCLPARIVFLKSDAAKQRIAPFLSEANRAKSMSAPVCAIIGHDTQFFEHLPRLFPHNQTARTWFEGKPEVIQATVMRNGSLQGAYLMMAARALGLDVGPMSGFDNAGVDKEFFADGRFKSNFVCNIGFGDPAGLFARSPRLAFDEIAQVL